jgi:hypothetical protein
MITDALRFAPSTAPTGDVSARLNASFPSPAVSGDTGMTMAFEASPLANDSVPEVAV